MISTLLKRGVPQQVACLPTGRNPGPLPRHVAPRMLSLLSKFLAQGGIESPLVEAEILMMFYGQMNRVELYMGERTLGEDQEIRLVTAAERRVQGMPLAYLLGETEFYGHRIFVNENVLIPRPETEILVQEALKLIPKKSCHVLDLGTGSGCIAVGLTLERPDIRMSALDVSEKALFVAGRNISFYGLGDRIALIQSDLFSALSEEKHGFFDMIVSNPPYIPSREMRGLPREVGREPILALDGGSDGMHILRKIFMQAHLFLRPGGYLLAEIGDGQSQVLAQDLATDLHYQDIQFVKDYNGIDRILIAQHG